MKPALISPGKPRLFLPLRRKPRLFLPASGVREVALEGKPRLFLLPLVDPEVEGALISPGHPGPPGVRETTSRRESRAYSSRLVESHNPGPPRSSSGSPSPGCVFSSICSLPRMISSTNSPDG